MTQPSEVKPDSPFVPSIDLLKLIKILSAPREGELIRYHDLTAEIGRDVQREARHLLRRARYRVEQEHGIVYHVEIGVGLRRMRGGDVAPAKVEERITSMRRGVRRTTKTIHCIDYAALPDKEKTKHNVASAQIGFLHHALKAKKMLAIERQAVNELPKGLLESAANIVKRKKGVLP